MIQRWKLKFTFQPSNSPPFVALHIFPLATNSAGDTNPQKSFHLKPEATTNGRQDANQTIPKLTVVTPQTVLTTLRNCTSDVVALSFFIRSARQPPYLHSKAAFRHMVSVVKNLTRRLGSVMAIVRKLEAVGCARKGRTLLVLMRIYSHGAMYEKVLETFDEMIRLYGSVSNTYEGNIAMHACFKLEHVDYAMKVLEETQVPNFFTFRIAIFNLCRVDDADKVKIVLRRMLRKGIYMDAKTYAMVLNCLCKFVRLEEALQLLSMMMVLGLPVSVYSWSALINGFCKSGKIDFAACLLEKMEKVGCLPNIVTYTPVIIGFVEHQNLGKADEIIGTMASKGCFPNVVLYNALIDCYSKMGQYKEAIERFLSMKELRITPDVHTFSSLVSTICSSREYDRLPSLISTIHVKPDFFFLFDGRIQPDLVACNCLIKYFCKAGHPQRAIDLYNVMVHNGFLPNKYIHYGLIRALCQLGRAEEAVGLSCELLCSSEDIDARVLHTVILDGLFKFGKLHEAMNVFSAAAAFEADVVTYGAAIGGLIKRGETKMAYGLFNQMKEVNVNPNERVYNTMLLGLCKIQNVYMVNRLLQEMVYRNMRIYRGVQQLMSSSLRMYCHAIKYFSRINQSP